MLRQSSRAASLLPGARALNPVFIIGCGRSGTTILGNSLARHREITYLNERRDLWFEAYPEADIWTDQAIARGGKMALTADDAVPHKSKKLRGLFWLETVRHRRPVLVEKLPINNFRLSFLHAIFPEACFIHIYRNGLEVARSIEQKSKKGGWFGAGRYKWNQLSNFAARSEETAALPQRCETYFDKGLLEWRLSTEAAVSFLKGLPQDRFMETAYQSFVEDPVSVMRRIINFIGVEDDEAVYAFVRENVARRTSPLRDVDLTAEQEILGGPLLKESMMRREADGLARNIT